MPPILTTILVAAIAAEHVWILVLEMFLWRTPTGLRAFRMTPAQAETTAVLAKNQGLYNGFLAAGLFASLLVPDPAVSSAFRLFFLSCVLVAGLFGAATVNRRIFFLQGLPAAVTLGLVLLG